ncbi:30S ribosomal protein S6 [Thermosediminibacter oceani]|uniref:Small ribosomal subunit protein bS6 n=1 Tax=Thermosediminibacter oceani (strain ATCC BAA-1034 / DSM 16646 / JW/IW-1228P) TaxID=555079 RepID=D9S187_THEOJ|nr:30S ribosomal protein S6 [Thermosediminibacter oceani]ADL08966.1 SSU ribosomal protein S6P [Thermosediminibacter oceani DSM 16646]
MREYETMYILDPELDEESINGLVDKFKALIEERGGEVKEIDRWGKRRLAYPISHRKEGYYVVMNFSATPSAAQEMERVFKITTGVLRHIIFRKDK